MPLTRDCIRLDADGRLIRSRDDLPDLEAGQHYIEVVLGGVCSTDEVIVGSRLRSRPLPPSLDGATHASVLGHEVIGRELGSAQVQELAAIVPAERTVDGGYRCMGLAASSHGGWGSIVIAENWARVPLPFPAPRFVLVDALAPGFALHQTVTPADERVVVLGLGALGLGALWGLAVAGQERLLGVDVDRRRREIASRLVPRAAIAANLRIRPDDRLVCALPTAALIPSMLAGWVATGCAIWMLTHPHWPGAVTGDSTTTGLTWLHSPPTDHAAAVEALAGADGVDALVSIVTHEKVLASGRLPARGGAHRLAIAFHQGPVPW